VNEVISDKEEYVNVSCSNMLYIKYTSEFIWAREKEKHLYWLLFSEANIFREETIVVKQSKQDTYKNRTGKIVTMSAI
jgi:hypothetical protein